MGPPRAASSGRRAFAHALPRLCRKPGMALAETMPVGAARGGWRALLAFGDSKALGAIVLLAPAVLFFLVVFVVPVGLMIRYSFYQQTSTGDLSSAATLANYVRLA